jgi:VanZ family protein
MSRSTLSDQPSAPKEAPGPFWLRSRALHGFVWGLLLVLWTIALLTPQPVQVAQAVLPDTFEFPISKLLHVTAYAVLAGLGVRLHGLGRYRWTVLALLSLHAFGTEFLQQFVDLRSPSWRDVGLDHLGIALGLLVSWRIRPR